MNFVKTSHMHGFQKIFAPINLFNSTFHELLGALSYILQFGCPHLRIINRPMQKEQLGISIHSVELPYLQIKESGFYPISNRKVSEDY